MGNDEIRMTNGRRIYDLQARDGRKAGVTGLCEVRFAKLRSQAGLIFDSVTQGSPDEAGQPWAGGRNPFGIDGRYRGTF